MPGTEMYNENDSFIAFEVFGHNNYAIDWCII